MTGPEHYREAERLLARFDEISDAHSFIKGSEAITAYLSAAQVHATLALAAATALHGADPTGIAWLEVAGA